VNTQTTCKQTCHTRYHVGSLLNVLISSRSNQSLVFTKRIPQTIIPATRKCGNPARKHRDGYSPIAIENIIHRR